MAMPEIQRLRATPVHYDDCDSLDRTGWDVPCDCTATADVEALLKLLEERGALITEAADVLDEIIGPDDDGR